jgi:hypothetical protein
MKKLFFTLMIPGLLAWTQIWQPGSTGYTFLKLGVGIRPVAMGNAFTALSDDGNAVFWNPSGLGRVGGFCLNGMYMNHLVYFNNYNLASAIPLGRKLGNLGVGLSYLAATDVEYSELGEPGGEFRNSDMLLNIGWGKTLDKKGALSVGGSVKAVRSQLYNISCFGALVDFGVILTPVKYFHIGTVIKNLGSPRKFIELTEYPPVNFRQGIAFQYPFRENALTLSFDYSIYPDVKPTFSLGGEIKIREPKIIPVIAKSLLGTAAKVSGFALMAGYQSGYQSQSWSGFSVGFAIEIMMAQNLYLDIGGLFLSYGYLGSSERIGLGLNYTPTKSVSKK